MACCSQYRKQIQITHTMKKSVATIVFIICVIMLSLNAFSQHASSSYKTALGLKFYPGAVTIKHFTKPNRALEGLGYFWDYGFRFTGLYEVHGDFAGAPGLKWYIGPGAHIGFWNDKYKDDWDNDDQAYFGFDGVLGLDYKIKGAPINISLDWQPNFSFGTNGYSGFEAGWGGIAVRYAW